MTFTENVYSHFNMDTFLFQLVVTAFERAINIYRCTFQYKIDT